MRASLFRISTDAEGESKIVLCVPTSELASVVMLNKFFLKELEVSVSLAPIPEMVSVQPIEAPEPIL